MENYKQELERLKKELNDRVDVVISKIDKSKFKIGKWYRVHKRIFCITKIESDGTLYGYGIDERFSWFNHPEINSQWNCACNCSASEIAVPATESEVKEALIKEAIKRGFKGKVSWKLLNNDKIVTREDEGSNLFGYSKDENSLLFGNYKIFCNGIWAELYKPKSIDEWANEFERYTTQRIGGCHSISDEFKTFITENNFKLPE
jgi:hypothetical protein